VLVTAAVIGMIAHRFAALPGPGAIVIGSGLALSSTAVVLQVRTLTGNYSVCRILLQWCLSQVTNVVSQSK
jgi:Kef-type K+ transport system membrane component KefB